MNIKKRTGKILRESQEKEGLLFRQVVALLNIDKTILSKVEAEKGKQQKNKSSNLQIFST